MIDLHVHALPPVVGSPPLIAVPATMLAQERAADFRRLAPALTRKIG